MNTVKQLYTIGNSSTIRARESSPKNLLFTYYSRVGSRSTDGNSSLFQDSNGNWVVATQNEQTGSNEPLHYASQANNPSITSGSQALNMANALNYVTLSNLQVLIS